MERERGGDLTTMPAVVSLVMKMMVMVLFVSCWLGRERLHRVH